MKHKAVYMVEIESDFASMIPNHLKVEKLLYDAIKEDLLLKKEKELPGFGEFDINVYKVMK